MNNQYTRITIYEYMRKRQQEALPLPPTIREIMAACDLSSGTVTKHLEMLHNEGMVKHEPYVSRGWYIPYDKLHMTYKEREKEK